MADATKALPVLDPEEAARYMNVENEDEEDIEEDGQGQLDTDGQGMTLLQWALADYVLSKGGLVYLDDVLYDLSCFEHEALATAADRLIGDGVLRSPAPRVYMPADVELDAAALAELLYTQLCRLDG